MLFHFSLVIPFTLSCPLAYVALCAQRSQTFYGKPLVHFFQRSGCSKSYFIHVTLGTFFNHNALDNVPFSRSNSTGPLSRTITNQNSLLWFITDSSVQFFCAVSSCDSSTSCCKHLPFFEVS